MNYSIRAASPSDVEPMLALFPRLAAFPLPPERRAEDLWEGDADLLRRWSAGAVPQCLVYVAVDTGARVVGVAMAQLREELLSHQPSAHLEVVAVHGDAEGHGIGRRLIEAVEQAVQARGARSLTLHVFGRNTRARSVYERIGFAGELIRYIKHFGESETPPVAGSGATTPEPGRVLGISGSLRAVSSNRTALGAAVALAPSPMRIVRFEGLGGLPLFNPDLDGTDPIVAVGAWRREVAAAEGLLISTPEYAHGVPGALKNALDWLVSGVEIVGKPVLLLNTSATAHHAQQSLRETLQTMAAVVLPEVRLAFPAAMRHRGASDVVADPSLAGPIRHGLIALAEAMASSRSPDHSDMT